MKIKILFSQFIFFLTCWFFTQSVFSEVTLKAENDTILETIQYDCFVNQNLLQTVNTSTWTWRDSFTSTGSKQYFRTISSAIDASSCSRIFVYKGTYKEQLTIKRNLTLVGEDKDGVVLDGMGLPNPGISIDSGSTGEVKLKGTSKNPVTVHAGG